jgi:hypothetical protein
MLQALNCRHRSAKQSTSRARIVKDGIRTVVTDRQLALGEPVKAIREFRMFTDQPLILRGSDCADAVQELNKAIDRAEALLR